MKFIKKSPPLAVCAISALFAFAAQADVDVVNCSETKDFGPDRIFIWRDTTNAGTLIVNDDGGRDVSILLVGGGGAGGYCRGGGGGGGGVVEEKKLHLSKGSYAITVGAGGVPQVISDTSKKCYEITEVPLPTINGGDSSFVGGAVNLVAFGGGAGATCTTKPGPNGENLKQGYPGASSGGSSCKWQACGSFVEGQGHSGGLANLEKDSASGGGGGAGEPGGDAGYASGSGKGGKGGDGVSSEITGESLYYGGGGGGGSNNGTAGAGGKGGGGDGTTGASPKPGADGFGGGGGGASGSGNSHDNCGGASGGSGVVIVKVVDEARREADYSFSGVASAWGCEEPKIIAKDAVLVWTNVAEMGSFEVLSKKGLDVEMLLVGGGGAGGYCRGGGGGGGGVVTQMVHLAKGSYTIVVGKGGEPDVWPKKEDDGKWSYQKPASTAATCGQDSELKNLDMCIVAKGGGGGANNTGSAFAGGSGGGAAHNLTAEGDAAKGEPGQGNDGGIITGTGVSNCGAGGGGAGAKGGNASAGGNPGDGGAGIYSEITGDRLAYGGGGGGGNFSSKNFGAGGSGVGGDGGGSSSHPTAGLDGFGGGGGGASCGGNTFDYAGGAKGGSGTVILRFCKKPASGLLMIIR